MAEPFATVADLQARGIATPDPDLATELCEDASDFLRDEIGWQVYPTAEITFVQRRDLPHRRGPAEVHLPGSPIRSISQVTIDGVVVDPARWMLVDNVLVFGIWRLEPYWQLRRPEASVIAVTYTVGYDSPPSDLMRWTRVLVADALQRIADGLPVGATPASMGVDDFKVAFSAAQQAGEMPIPERVLERLRSRYGSTAFVTSG